MFLRAMPVEFNIYRNKKHGLESSHTCYGCFLCEREAIDFLVC